MNSIIMTGFGRISAACGCHTGRRRKNNEDNFFFAGRYMASDNNGLGSILEKSFSLKKDRFFAVFDGMGGGEYGEIASYIAAKASRQLRPVHRERKETRKILTAQEIQKVREISRGHPYQKQISIPISG